MSPVLRHFADWEIQPLKGSLNLYSAVLATIREHWLTQAIGELQSSAYEIVPEAALFPLWTQLREAKLNADQVSAAREHLSNLQDALAALLTGTYEPEQLDIVRSLGRTPKLIADRYDSLLKVA